MTALLPRLEAKGIFSCIVEDHLKVTAPDNVLDDRMVDYLRDHKPEIMAEVRLRDFCKLVQAYGVSHGLLLDHAVIEAELDDDDRRELITCTYEERQVWAQLLAYRLTRPRRTSAR